MLYATLPFFKICLHYVSNFIGNICPKLMILLHFLSPYLINSIVIGAKLYPVHIVNLEIKFETNHSIKWSIKINCALIISSIVTWVSPVTIPHSHHRYAGNISYYFCSLICFESKIASSLSPLLTFDPLSDRMKLNRRYMRHSRLVFSII